MLILREWWESLFDQTGSIGIPWVSVLGFLRITTNPRIMSRPLPVDVALDHVRSWLENPHVRIVNPGERHAGILFQLLEKLETAGNLTTDAHLAALAIEHDARLASADGDFSRFPGLRWLNPLSPAHGGGPSQIPQ